MSKEELEKQIEEAAEKYSMDWSDPFADDHFIAGAKSETAKELHQKGMISEEDAINFAKFARFDVNSNHKDLKWKELLNNFLKPKNEK